MAFNIASAFPAISGGLGLTNLLTGLINAGKIKRPDDSLLKQNVADYTKAANLSRQRAYNAQNRALTGYSPAELASMLGAVNAQNASAGAQLRGLGGSRGALMSNLSALAQKQAGSLGNVYAADAAQKLKNQQYADVLG